MTNLLLLGDVRLDAGLIPFINTLLVCGFPSPADDYQSELVDLNRLMLRHPDASFLARAVGESMTGSGHPRRGRAGGRPQHGATRRRYCGGMRGRASSR